MNTKSSRTILVIAVLMSLTLAACDLIEDDSDESVSNRRLVGLRATIEALSPEQAAALATAAAPINVQSLSPAQVTAAVATEVADRAEATAVGQVAESGERVNATQAPSVAPIIVYFFASAPNQAQVQGGIRYFLNWTTEKANLVEIYGHVMDNPAQGSWAVYNDSNDWVLWAANDQAWVEEFLPVQPDQDTGNSLQNVSVGLRNTTLTFRDPQFVDGDQIAVDVNGVRVLDSYVNTGRHVSFPVVLQPGANTVNITAQNAGVTPPLVAEVTVGKATRGPAVQSTRGLNAGESQSFTITAP